MHRSGTSAVARGLQALSVYLGNDLYGAHPENPSGYFEDRSIVELDERVLKALGVRWDDVAPLERRRFSGWRMWRLRSEARRYLRRRFLSQPLWGFKDPRTIRLLPFWLRTLHECGVEDAYVLVIRNPSSIAASLFARQEMDLQTAQRLWLVYMVPFLDELAHKPLAVVDYDLLVADPRGQLARIARTLNLPVPGAAELEAFAGNFLDATFRHTVFSPDEIDASTDAGRLTRDAFALLYELAADRAQPTTRFWSAWQRIAAECRTRLAWPSTA